MSVSFLSDFSVCPDGSTPMICADTCKEEVFYPNKPRIRERDSRKKFMGPGPGRHNRMMQRLEDLHLS